MGSWGFRAVDLSHLGHHEPVTAVRVRLLWISSYEAQVPSSESVRAISDCVVDVDGLIKHPCRSPSVRPLVRKCTHALTGEAARAMMGPLAHSRIVPLSRGLSSGNSRLSQR